MSPTAPRRGAEHDVHGDERAPARVRLFNGIRPVSRAGVLRDMLAGITLASMNIPQVLGYTRIAGTPIVTGLYTVLLPVMAFALLGSSRHLVVAADSATAAILASSLGQMAPPESAKYVALVGMVALLTAALLFAARIFRLGFLADFLSRTVLVGFLTGVGFQVGIAMLGGMFGIAVASPRTLAQLQEFLQGLPHLHPPTLALSVAVAGAPSSSAIASRRACRSRSSWWWARSQRARRSTSPGTVSPSSVRSRAGCRRSRCPT